jgi:FdhE protein
VSTAAWLTGSNWEKRIERAKLKAGDSPWAEELLRFYRHILEFQKAVYESVRSATPRANPTRLNLRESLDLHAAAAFLPGLVETVKQWAPAKLRQEAEEFGSLSEEQVHDRLQTAIVLSPRGDAPADFFARAVLQPLAEWIAKNWSAEAPAVAGNKCPSCEGEPQVAILRQEGDGGKRWLLCSFCLTEWEFHRILCPNCGEREHDKLPRFTGEGNPAVRLEACDSCLAYLKSFDLTVDGMIVPLVDDIATAPLDIWAAEKGYRKLQPNLFGV